MVSTCARRLADDGPFAAPAAFARPDATSAVIAMAASVGLSAR
jgi:hypothetical protein